VNATHGLRAHHHRSRTLPAVRGFSMLELLVAMSISLVLLLALVNLYVNISRSNDEMAKTTSLIENGRVALQMLENDLLHAGFWGGYLPAFDDLAATVAPGDVPAALPNPCEPFANWGSSYRMGLIGIPVQPADVLPSGAGCVSPAPLRAGTDALVVRHLEMCVPGSPNCEPAAAGKVYFQTSTCAAESNAGTAQSGTANTIVLDTNAAGSADLYVGVMLRLVGGLGAGQYRTISNYNGGNKTATISTPWTTVPNTTTRYAFEFALSNNAFPLHRRDCVGTGTPATLPITAGTPAERRLLISNLYYVTNLPHPDRVGEFVPTLMRTRLDVSGGLPAHRAPVALIDGIEALRVEVGIDDVSETGAPVDFTLPVNWADSTTKHSPTNRGDGTPDRFIRCTTATPCGVAQLMNAVAVKLWVLARSRDLSPGYTDSKRYCVGTTNPNGSCPASNTIAPSNDGYKRHVFATTVRLINVSGRRETPFP
jgi:prepilin-type N-terminal cleavage/methylation domain-containing protein